MKNPSPLRRMQDGSEEKECRLIIIDDDIPIVNEVNNYLNFMFSRIKDYEYENGGNPFQRLEFWKNIRMYLQLKNRKIMGDTMRIRLLSSRVYERACIQETLFANECLVFA